MTADDLVKAFIETGWQPREVAPGQRIPVGLAAVLGRLSQWARESEARLRAQYHASPNEITLVRALERNAMAQELDALRSALTGEK